MSHDELFTVVVEVEPPSTLVQFHTWSSDDVDEPLTPSLLLVGLRPLNLPDSVNCERDPDIIINSLSQRMTCTLRQTAV